MQKKIDNLILSMVSLTAGLLVAITVDNYNDQALSSPSKNSRIIEEFNFESINDKYIKLVETAQELQQQKLEEQIALEKEQERLRLEEEQRIREEEERLLQEQQLIENSYYSNEIEFTLTFYTCLPSENLGYTTTAWGEIPQYGMVASNVYDRGTRIYLEGYGEFIVADRGGSNFDSYNRLDVFIPRIDGESDYEYSQRVMALGVVDVKGYIIN